MKKGDWLLLIVLPALMLLVGLLMAIEGASQMSPVRTVIMLLLVAFGVGFAWFIWVTGKDR